MLNMKMDKINDTTVKLVIDGDLTVENIRKVHSKICDLFSEVDDLTLTIGENVNMDLTFAQVICTTHKAFITANKKFAIDGCICNVFDKTDETGYTRHKGCSLDKFHNCVLVKKEAS